jgi:hypothetical protein
VPGVFWCADIAPPIDSSTYNMWQFAQIGNSSIEEKPKYSIDVIVAIEDRKLRDFYVNYEHTYLSEKLPSYRPIPTPHAPEARRFFHPPPSACASPAGEFVLYI